MADPKRRIDGFLSSLPELLRLRDGKEFWPRYLYHVSDIRNVVSILKTESLLSRNEALATGAIGMDSARRSIVDQTPAAIRDSVRLYWRPCAPTHYRTEGFRTADDIAYADNPMPIPVVLLFSAADVLSQPNALVTEGNAATGGCAIGGGLEFIRSLPFEHIYSDARDGIPLTIAQEKATFHRNAEVCVPSPFAYGPILRAIRTRSRAETDMLLNLLSEADTALAALYAPRIEVNRSPQTFRNLFFRRWLYVDTVVASGTRIRVDLNLPRRGELAEFEIEIEIVDLANWRRLTSWRWHEERSQMTFSLPQMAWDVPYVVRVSIDGVEAYRNLFHPRTSQIL